jgi:spore coat protein H
MTNMKSSERLTRRDVLKAALAIMGVVLLPAQAACKGKNQGTAATATETVTSTTSVTSTLPPVISTVTATRPATITSTVTENAAGIPRPAGWSKLTHGNNVEPDYGTVFPSDRVNRLKINVSPQDWDAMQADLQQLLGSGRGGQIPGGQIPIQPGGQFPNIPGVNPVVATPPGAGEPVPAAEPVPPGGGGGDMTPVNPMWVPCTLEFSGLIWTNVGVRYKGNSSLRSGFQSRSQKLPLKLDFDQFENEHPEINNQRFFGFKQLSLSNAFSDNTYMHEAITYDLLEEAGLPASKTAFYQIIMDYGQGEKDLGIYIVVEVPDDTAIARYFGEDTGNIYEGDGSGVSLAAGTTPARIQSSFQKENNPDSDWSDLVGLYDALQSKMRATDAASWRTGLEKVFDVDSFLEWLAISAIIQNWDNYGQMSHNFYLYHDPDSGRLVWISWDHNQVLAGSGAGAGGGMNRNVSLDKKDVGANWPLIRFLLDDPTYYHKYLNFLSQAIEGPFTVEKMQFKTQQYSALLKPYMNQASFTQAVQQLNNVVSQRIQAVRSFLANP